MDSNFKEEIDEAMLNVKFPHGVKTSEWIEKMEG